MNDFAAYTFDACKALLPEDLVAIRDGKQVDMPLDKAASKTKGKVTLAVDIIATHSGALINGRVYPGVAMKDSSHTWMSPYPKLITDSHPDMGLFSSGSEPKQLGRVMDYEYVRLEPDDEKFKTDWKEPDEGGKGSGYMRLKTGISDREAIEKIIDQRYLTVSQGSKLHRAICSICGTDWIKSGIPCDHRPGKVYERESGDSNKKKTEYSKCFLIAGPMTYDHCAVVNRPGDVHAKIVGHDSFDNSIFKSVPDGQVPLATVSSIAIIDELGPTHLYREEEARVILDSKGGRLQSTLVSLPPYEPHPVAENPTEEDMKDKDEKPESTEDETGENKAGEDPEGTQGKETPEDPKEPEDKKGESDKDDKPEKPEAEGEEEEEEEEEPENKDSDSKSEYSKDLLIQIGALRASKDTKVDWESMGISEDELQNIDALDAEQTAKLRDKYEEDQYVGPFVAVTKDQIEAAKKLLVHVKVEDKAKVLLDLDEKSRLLEETAEKKKKEATDARRLATQLDNVRASLQAKNKEQEKLFEQITAKDAQLRVKTAESIVLMKQILGREDVKFDSDEEYTSTIKSLAARDSAYLEGTYEDLRKEVGQVDGLTTLAPGFIEDPTKPAEPSGDVNQEGEDSKKEDEKIFDAPPGTSKWSNREFNKLLDSEKGE